MTNPIHTYSFIVPPEAIDENGHVNNVQYVQWMQDAAVRHYSALGGIPLAQAVGATWVVRSHQIEYLLPALLGEELQVATWVATLRRVRSVRRYRFTRLSDGKLIATGATEWVFVDVKTGRPVPVPPEIIGIFPLLPDEP